MSSARNRKRPLGFGMRRRVAGFVHTLRDAGFAVGRAETGDAARVIASPLADRPERLRGALKALFASDRSEFQALRRPVRRLLARARRQARGAGRDDRRGPRPLASPWGGVGRRRGAFRRDRAGGRARGACRRGAWARARRLGARGAVDEGLRAPDGRGRARRGRSRSPNVLRASMRTRLSRRDRARRRGLALDLRATLRRSVARGGEPIDLKFRRRQAEAACASSRCSTPPARWSSIVSVFTRFLHAVAQTFRESEAYLFHTRLAHVSSALSERHPAARARPALADGAGRRRRHEDRRLPRRVQPRPRQARPPFARLRDDLFRRLRHRRAGKARGRDARASPPLPAHRLAQSADRARGLRPGRARHAGRAALRRSVSRRRTTSPVWPGSNPISRGSEMGVLERAAAHAGQGRSLRLATVVRTLSITAAKAGRQGADHARTARSRKAGSAAAARGPRS